jgi:hypothetical protein
MSSTITFLYFCPLSCPRLSCFAPSFIHPSRVLEISLPYTYPALLYPKAILLTLTLPYKMCNRGTSTTNFVAVAPTRIELMLILFNLIFILV